MARGGDGNDLFTFVLGDLSPNGSGLDSVLDFAGAGQPQGSGGEQDQLLFVGFGENAALSFIRNQAGDPTRQVYEVSGSEGSGRILIQLADGTAQLAAGDFAFA